MIHFKPNSGVVADPIPFYWAGKFHLFYLRYWKDFVDPLIWSHSVTSDFLSWEELPDAVPTGGKGSPDEKGCWTGSVIEHAGTFHIFYTGWNEIHQTICHATSKDLIGWEKDPKNPIIMPETSWFGGTAWRDPYVFWNPADKKWWMVITAQAKDLSGATGRLALVKSADLERWTTPSDLGMPPICQTPECPDLFRKGNLWYAVFSDFNKTNYISTPDFKTWNLPEPTSLDDRFFYAGKCFHAEEKDYLVGWLPKLKDAVDEGQRWFGGRLSTPRELYINPARGLSCRFPAMVAERFAGKSKPVSWADGKIIRSLKDKEGLSFVCSEKNYGNYILKVTIKRKTSSFSWGVAIRTDENLVEGYFLELREKEGEAVLRNCPYSIASTTVSFPSVRQPFIPRGNKISLWVVSVDDNMEFFVDNQIVLSGKGYKFCKGKIGFFILGGEIEILEGQIWPLV